MNVLDAKVIPTELGLEIFVDELANIEIKEVRIPSITDSFYEALFGVHYFLLRKEKDYDSYQNYFSICMSHDFSFISIKEAEVESLFAVKNEEERQAAKTLITEWFIQTNSYKKAVKAFIRKVKVEGHLETVTFLNKLLQLTPEELKSAPIEKKVECLKVY